MERQLIVRKETMSNTGITKYDNKALISFFTLVIILSLAAEAYIITDGPLWMYFVLMWIPAFSAIIASAIALKENNEKFSLKGFLSGLGIRRCRIRYILLAVFIPLIYLLIPYMIYWKTHPDNFGYTGVALSLILKDCLPTLIIGIFPGILSAMGEEIGWRGYMLPALTERSGMKKALIITSLFWACWHLPLLAFGDYMAGAPVWYKLPAFVLCILPVGIIIGGLTYLSKSVWPAAFLHAAHNNYDQAVFGVITRGDDMMYYVSETGFLTIICAWVIAIIMIVTIKDIAAKEDDNDLRIKVAKEWSELNSVEITSEMINCAGCRIEGMKTPFCDSLCPIRQCTLSKDIETCGDCGEMSTCEKLEMITGNNDEALKRLIG